jgi:hypothetical protein
MIMTKFVIKVPTAENLEKFIELWEMTGPAKWKCVKTAIKCPQSGYNVEISVDEDAATEAIADGLFGERGFLSERGWYAVTA